MKEPLILVENLSYAYFGGERCALRGVNLSIKEGEYVAVIGANGSGKTTLLKHLNALLTPTSGDVIISGWNTKDHFQHIEIRKTMGVVFQDPSASIVQSTVEEEVAFGPENLGIPVNEIGARVERSLETVGLLALRERPCAFLSAGQKQLLSIAAALAMDPRCLLLDEATAMLDFSSRERFIDTFEGLNRDGTTIISVTQDMDEAARAGRLIVLSEGRVAMDGKAKEVFAKEVELQSHKLALPQAARLAARLRESVPGFPSGILTISEMATEIEARVMRRSTRGRRA